MTTRLPATYTDKHGTIHTVLINDSEELRIDLEGALFAGRFLDDFEPQDPVNLPRRFTLDELGNLTACKILCKFPISTWKGGNQIPGFLLTEINLMPSPQRSFFNFSFEFPDGTIDIGRSEVFEGAFDVLKRKLPGNIVLKACYTCQYADYSVSGSQVFGSMLCFRNQKEAYLGAKGKDQYMEIMGHFDRMVQEIYLCPDFEERGENIGYRG